MAAVLLLPLYILFHIHALRHIFRWLRSCKISLKEIWVKIIVGAVYGILVMSLPMGFLLSAGTVQRFLKLIGNFMLGLSLYEAILILIADIICLISKRIKRASEEDTEKEGKKSRVTAISGCLLTGLIVITCIIGVINARIIRTTEYEISIDKKVDWMKELNVVMVGDFHLGYNAGSRQMKKMVKKINAENPDIVLIVGDIFDNDYDALDDPDELKEILKGIDSRYGVYAVYGNHDIQEKRLAGFSFGGKKDKQADDRMDSFLKDSGIELLRDNYILVDNKFYIYGRPDVDRPGKGIEKRKTPDELVKNMNKSKPIIVLDHQPKELGKLSEAGVDLDLSGHTHNGQIWPCNLLTRLMWDNSYGHEQIGNMHSIVTSGVGTFGPNMRIGTKAEICHIEIKMGN